MALAFLGRAFGAEPVDGGLAVVVGCKDPDRLVDLGREGRFVVHGLDTDPETVKKARASIKKSGLYGRVSVARFDGKNLPYVDNLVNRIVISDQLSVTSEEIQRVLAPRGAAVIGGKKTVKSVQPQIDEWTHHHHGADNNAVATDTVVGPPRRFQWINAPLWTRSHLGIPSINSMISANGRVFTIEDRGSVENPVLPGKVYLYCRDAYNGIVLWRHRFPDWHPSNIFIKLTPSQLQRQLVAIGDRVYCTPGLNAPITLLDAATGDILKKYDGTEMTQEFVCDGGVIYAVVGDPVDTSSLKRDTLALDDSSLPFDEYSPEIPQKKDPRSVIAAMDAESGRVLWRKDDDAMKGYLGASLAVRDGNVVYATSSSIACLDHRDGKERWNTSVRPVETSSKKRTRFRGYLDKAAPRNTVTVVLSGKAVYLASCKSLYAFSIKDGSKLWTAQTRMNHHKPPDVFVVGDKVWTANNTAYDAMTGKKVKGLSQRMTGPMGHDRCYQNRITTKWYINTVSGGSDFLGLDEEGEFPHPWGRSTCGIGHLPCNGLLYLGPPACSCSNKVQLISFNALAAEPGLKTSGQPLNIAVNPRLEKGSAYSEVRDQRSEVSYDNDWLTYRKDAARSGSTSAVLGGNIKPLWKVKLNTRGSQPIIVGEKLYVADVDAHAACGLNAVDGKLQWRFTAGGRIDSPPTWHQGRLLFGCADGWVYCLRAGDGALAWRFKALPDRMICAYEQVESAWPVCGSVLVKDGIAYFVAGRNSYVDGGLFMFGLDPATGRMVHYRNMYGPYEANGHPVISKNTAIGGTGAGGVQGNKGDILSARGEQIFLRHEAFRKDLSSVKPGEHVLPHLIPSHCFVNRVPHHRSFWTIGTKLYYDRKANTMGAKGDILVMDENKYYEVRGYPPGRYTTYDIRNNQYTLFAGEYSIEKRSNGNKRRCTELWKTTMPLPVKPCEHWAATELSAFLKMIYPEDSFPVVTAIPASGDYILLGTLASLKSLERHVGASEVDDAGEFVIKHTKDGSQQVGIICGNNARGVLDGAYSLLEQKLGYGFYLHTNALENVEKGAFSFDKWDITASPEFSERTVMNWYNFISGVNSWNLPEYKEWIRQSARMRYTSVMLHAYSWSPLTAWSFNGKAKPVSYIQNTAFGKQWGNLNVKDVRKLFGGEILTDEGPIFGADVTKIGYGNVTEANRVALSKEMLKEVVDYAVNTVGMEFNWAFDIDTGAAHPQSIIKSLPTDSRFQVGKRWIVRPDTEAGYRYYKHIIETVMTDYPGITTITAWWRTFDNFSHDGLVNTLKSSELPDEWKAEYDAAPDQARRYAGPGNLYYSKVTEAFRKALDELGHEDVKLGYGSWWLNRQTQHDLFAASDHFQDRAISAYALDCAMALGESDTLRAEMRKTGSNRRLIVIEWAQNDMGKYIGRPYAPPENFRDRLKDVEASGFGVLHWTTRPLDVFFKNLQNQIWNNTLNEDSAVTCKKMAVDYFGVSQSRVMAEYLHSWLTTAPQFGRPAKSWIKTISNGESRAKGCDDRIAILDRVDTGKLTEAGLRRWKYFRGHEEWIKLVHLARDVEEKKTAIRKFIEKASVDGGMTRGEKGLLIQHNLKWLNDSKGK